MLAPKLPLRTLSGAAVLSLLLASATPAAAKGAKPAPKASPATKADAVARAMRRLDEDVLASEEDMNEQHKVFTRSIAGIDFLLDPAAGKGAAHADRLDRCFDAVARYVDGAAAHERARKPGKAEDEMSAMQWSQTTWSLSAASLFCAELVARGTKKTAATATLRTAMELLEKSQQADGGFGHDRDGRPRLPEIEIGGKKIKYPNTLVSASCWAGLALGVGRSVGGKGIEPVVAKAKAYFASAVDPDGTYPYDPSQRGEGGGSDPTAAARTAGAYAALRALGLSPKDKSLARTGDWLKKHVDEMPEGHGSAPHGVFFGAIACLEIGPDAKKSFDDLILPRILAAQDADEKEGGALDCICKKAFATTCESFHGADLLETMGAGRSPAAWQTWRRAYVNALNLFALLASSTKPRFLDGIPADAPTPGAVTPSDPAGSPPAMSD
jgi:hypothetical protein